jgi:hypothetical protein
MYLPAVVGPLLLPAVIVGAGWGIASKDEGERMKDEKGERSTSSLFHPSSFILQPLMSSHRRRCDFVIAALPLGILAVHSVFWFFGKFSGGELRYLLVVAPFWALTAARGWEWICRRASIKWTLITAIILAALPATVDYSYTVVPIRYSRAELLSRNFADWYHTHPKVQQRYPNILSPQPTVFYMMDLCPTGGDGVIGWNRDVVENPPPGVLMVYEKILATYNSDKRMVIDPATSLPKGGWVLFDVLGNDWAIYVSRIVALGHTSTPESLSSKP